MNTNTNSSNLRNLLGDFDPAKPPPRVDPVPEGVRRPRWSVMIPTFNCASYLRQTLESVLAQDLGPEEMQIEVIDDCSTKDDPEAVVREVGRGRVTFHRKEKNEGSTSNFNTCIARSRGQLVHILHGDDWVLPGFYTELGEMAKRAPNHALYACRSFFVDAQGIINSVTPHLPELANGGHDVGQFFHGTALQFAGVAIQRNFFEKQGGFRTNLVHCTDWEMWVRAITKGGGMISSEALACYRVFEGNESSRFVKTAENLKDITRLHFVIEKQGAQYPLGLALLLLHKRALQQAVDFGKRGEHEAAQAAKIVAKVLSKETKGSFLWFTDLLRTFSRKSQNFADLLDSKLQR